MSKKQFNYANRNHGGSKVNTGALSNKFKGQVGALVDNGEDGNVIRIQITNSGQTTKTLCLFPGALTSVSELQNIAGITVDAIIAEGTNSDVTVDCPNLAFIHREIAYAPQRVKSVLVECDSAVQLNNPLEMIDYSLTSHGGVDRLVLTNYKDAKNNNDKMVRVDNLEWMQLDRSRALFTKVAAGHSVTFEFTLGERISLPQTFESFAALV